MAAIHQQVALQAPSLHWYQVALTAKTLLYGKVQAKNPDSALRMVMRENDVSSVAHAHIWLLGRKGPPVVRHNVRCRLPRR